MKLTVWLKERELNARRIAATKTGDDRSGWIDDANHFQAALAAVEGQARAQAAQAPAVEARSLTWTLDGDKDCGYNNWLAVTPFGRILITWKGWKEHDDACVDEFPGEPPNLYGKPDEVKEAAEREFWRRADALKGSASLASPATQLQAESKSQYKRLTAQGANVAAPQTEREGAPESPYSGLTLAEAKANIAKLSHNDLQGLAVSLLIQNRIMEKYAASTAREAAAPSSAGWPFQRQELQRLFTSYGNALFGQNIDTAERLAVKFSTLLQAAPQAPIAGQAASPTKEQLIALCEQAGIRWIPPEDEEGGFPGGFDMATLREMGLLVTLARQAPSTVPQAAPEGDKP